MAIPAQFIDELVARCDIVDVVSDYVPLTQKGGSYWGLCPFHGEKTASFHVAPDRQIYHCFGCKKGGGAISFVMELENLPFPEAVRLLSKRAGLVFPEEAQGDRNASKRRERLLLLNKEAARFFYNELQSGGQAEVAGRYLQSRGLSQGTAKSFGLGFAPDGWDNLLTAMGAKGYTKQELIDAGLSVSNKNGRIYDRFRNRLMFPIIDLRGDVIGFGGRVLDDGTPKYLNSPDTVVFNKSENLFGLNLARKTKLGRIVLTEGYMDTIALYQAGFDCAVASLGTAFTPQHARLLSRFTQEVVIAYDSDTAGVSAAKRAIPLLEKTGIRVKVLQIQGAKDPDEYIKLYGRESFAQLLNQSEEHMDYLLTQIQGGYRLEEPAQKVSFAKEAAAAIADLPSSVEREIYAGRTASMVGIEKEAMMQEVNLALKRKQSKVKKKQERQDLLPTQNAQPKARQLRYDNLRSARAEEGILRLLVLDNTLFSEVEDLTQAQFSSSFLGKIFELLQQRWRDGRPVHPGALADGLTSEELSHLTQVLQRPEALGNGKRALWDYRSTMETAQLLKAEDSDESILAAKEKYQKMKGMGDS